jgi:hypothetical protein
VCGWIHEKKGRKQKQSHSLRSGMLYSGSFQALFRLFSGSFRLFSGSFQALFRLFSGSVTFLEKRRALLRLFSGSIKAPLRLFSGSIRAQSHSLRSGVLY